MALDIIWILRKDPSLRNVLPRPGTHLVVYWTGLCHFGLFYTEALSHIQISQVQADCSDIHCLQPSQLVATIVS